MLVKFIYESYTLHAVLQCHESVSGGGVFSPTQTMWYHSSQPSHCIMLSRHSGISQVQNTSISWYVNHGYGGTRARLCECGKGVSFCLVKHLAKCCRILSCSNSISSKLSPLAAWKAYAIAYTPQSATPCCISDDTHPVVSFLNLLHHFVPSKVCSKLGGLAVSAQILSPTYNIDTRKYL